MVGRLEGFVGGSVLVHDMSHTVPIFQTGVGWSAQGHCCNDVLNMGIETPVELDHDGFWVSVPSDVLHLLCA